MGLLAPGSPNPALGNRKHVVHIPIKEELGLFSRQKQCSFETWAALLGPGGLEFRELGIIPDAAGLLSAWLQA